MTTELPRTELKPYRASLESWTSGDPDDWPNTVSVTAVERWNGNDETEPIPDSEFRYADLAGTCQLVQVDTNYKDTRESEHTVQLTRPDAVKLAAHILQATEDTFHAARVGSLRTQEAADVLHAIQELDYALAELRSHALEDLMVETGVE